MNQDTHPAGTSVSSGLLERLAAAEGAVVYDAQGKRLGMFIELLEGGSDMAIRHDGAFVWRRRILPVANVAAVLPEHGPRGAVVLNADDKTLVHSPPPTRRERNHAHEAQTPAEDQLPSADDECVLEEGLTSRPAPYVARDSSDQEVRPSISNDESVERYLLFIPTPHGYHLVEQSGSAPAVFADVSLPSDESAFFVIKVGRSPLPGDGRLCAYLEPS